MPSEKNSTAPLKRLKNPILWAGLSLGVSLGYIIGSKTNISCQKTHQNINAPTNNGMSHQKPENRTIKNEKPQNQKIINRTIRSLKTELEIKDIAQETSIFGSENIEKAKKLVNALPEEEIQSHLKKLINIPSLHEIEDIKQFSGRLIEEAQKHDTDLDINSYAELYPSLSSRFEAIDNNYLEVKKTQPIYIHIDIGGGLGTSSQKFFIKWVNTDNDNIILFEEKPMNASSQKNWVSYQPNKFWQPGNYEVSFYQLSSSLEKLATTSFYIHSIQRQK